MNRENGAAIIMAILITALAASLAASLLWLQDSWVRRVEIQQDRSSAIWVARAGVDFAAAVLNDDARNNHVDYQGEAWSLNMPPTPLEGGEISGYISDQQGLFNLNNLVKNGKTDAAQKAAFVRLLTTLALPPELADSLGDWLDADSEPQNTGGAEDSYYLALPNPYRTANMPINEIDDLLQIKGFDRKIIERLKPFVTVLPGYTPINVNTASPEVLAAVLPEISLGMARGLVSGRTSNHFKDLNDFLSRLPAHQGAADVTTMQVASQYFLVSVECRIGRAKVHFDSLLDREGVAWPRTIWRRTS